MSKGIDCAIPLTADKAKVLAAAGMKFACRYLVPVQYAWKRLTRAEAEAITAAGMQVVSVFETTANRPAGGAAAGQVDGTEAFKETQLIDQPKGTTIYFAVDYDAQPKDYNAIEDYLRSAASKIPGYEVGVYASFAVIEEMSRRGVSKHFWQTYAWSNGNRSARANIFQYKNGQTMENHTVDLNESSGSEGWWDTNSNPQQEGKLVDKKADFHTQDALRVLQTTGVIQTPEYWVQNAYEGGVIKGEYAALLIQNMAKKLGGIAPQPQPAPTPHPEPPKPALYPTPKTDAELTKLATDTSIYFEVGGKNGSGVLLPNGYVLTAGHVPADVSMRIQTKDRAWHNVSLVAVHPRADIALCRIHEGYEGLPSLPISIRGVKSGDKLLSVGHGKQKMWAKETGEVVREKTGDKEWEFDCSVAGESGDSGSAIVNECGEIVGVMVQTASVSVKNAKGNWGIAVGCEAVNVTHPVVAEFLKKYL